VAVVKDAALRPKDMRSDEKYVTEVHSGVWATSTFVYHMVSLSKDSVPVFLFVTLPPPDDNDDDNDD
jgi:hypothetical protein